MIGNSHAQHSLCPGRWSRVQQSAAHRGFPRPPLTSLVAREVAAPILGCHGLRLDLVDQICGVSYSTGTCSVGVFRARSEERFSHNQDDGMYRHQRFGWRRPWRRSLCPNASGLLRRQYRRRLILENLEPRTVLTTLTFTSVTDGVVADRDWNGSFETVDATGTSITDRWFQLDGIGQERGVFEFNLAGVAPGPRSCLRNLDSTSRPARRRRRRSWCFEAMQATGQSPRPMEIASPSQRARHRSRIWATRSSRWTPESSRATWADGPAFVWRTRR